MHVSTSHLGDQVPSWDFLLLVIDCPELSVDSLSVHEGISTTIHKTLAYCSRLAFLELNFLLLSEHYLYHPATVFYLLISLFLLFMIVDILFPHIRLWLWFCIKIEIKFQCCSCRHNQSKIYL